MNIKKTVIAFFFVPSILIAQNLVKNPDFKDTRKVLSANINALEGWRGFGTVDYYHPNNKKYYPWYSVPNNWNGYVQPKSGDGFAGFILYSEDGCFELIQGELLQPLKPMKQYKVSFWIMLTNEFSAGKNLGVYFSNDSNFLKCSESKIGFRFLDYVHCYDASMKAHISTPEAFFLTDTAWTEISGIYTASGGEKYFTIGMFWQDNKEIVEAYNKAKEPIKSKRNKSIRRHKSNIKNFYVKLENYILIKNPYKKDNKTYIFHEGNSVGAYYFLDAVSVIPLDSVK